MIKITPIKKLPMLYSYLALHNDTLKSLEEQCNKCPQYQMLVNFMNGTGPSCEKEGLYVEPDKTHTYVEKLHKDDPDYDYMFCCLRWLLK